jgi:hypothetical protein
VSFGAAVRLSAWPPPPRLQSWHAEARNWRPVFARALRASTTGRCTQTRQTARPWPPARIKEPPSRTRHDVGKTTKRERTLTHGANAQVKQQA